MLSLRPLFLDFCYFNSHCSIGNQVKSHKDDAKNNIKCQCLDLTHLCHEPVDVLTCQLEVKLLVIEVGHHDAHTGNN
jgi:hypothetical protein